MPRRAASVSNRADHEPLATAGRAHEHAMRLVRTRRHIPEHRQVRRAGRIRQVPQVPADQGERVLHPSRHRSHEPHHQVALRRGPLRGPRAAGLVHARKRCQGLVNLCLEAARTGVHRRLERALDAVLEPVSTPYSSTESTVTFASLTIAPASSAACSALCRGERVSGMISARLVWIRFLCASCSRRTSRLPRSGHASSIARVSS